jgi:hypothetical protein
MSSTQSMPAKDEIVSNNDTKVPAASGRRPWTAPKLTRLDITEAEGGRNAPPERGNHRPS